MKDGPNTNEQKTLARLDLKRPGTFIPKGPYKTKGERWNALDRLLDFNALREKEGLSKISNGQIEKLTKIPFDEMEREINSQAFQGMRIARATIKIQSSLVEVAPTIKKILMDIQSEIQGDRKLCDECQKTLKKTPLTNKEKDSYLGTIERIMDRAGFDKVDLASADVMNELNMDEALAEGIKIVEELTGQTVPIQRFIVALTEPGTLRKNKGKALAPRLDATPSQDSKEDGPIPALQTVSVHDAPHNVDEEISLRNNLEPPLENKLDML